MNSDNFTYAKSAHPQSLGEYTTFTEKQWNYVSDINNGVYTNNSGLTLVSWDLTSIYNAAGMADVSDLFLAIPIVMVAQTTANAAGVQTATTAPTAGYGLCSLKTNYQNLIHQIEVVSNGKTVSQAQPFVNVYEHFKLLSTLSATDMSGIGPSLNINGVLDNEKSAQWNPQLNSTGATAAATASTRGIGLYNNLPFYNNGATATNIPNIQTVGQNAYQSNNAIFNRINRFADTTANASTANGSNGFYGSNVSGSQPFLLSSTQLGNEFKPYYTVSSNVMIWYDLALIPLKYICDCIDKMGLVKKLDMGLRIYFNTGSVQVAVVNPNATTTGYGQFTSNFSTTCPLTINYLNGTSANGGFAATTNMITAGVFIARSPTTFGPAVPITIAAAAHAMPSCRVYYSMIKLDPQRMLTYVSENQSKQILYENFYFNQYQNIAVGGTFSQLIQSGIKAPIGILIVPFVSSSTLQLYSTGSAIGYNQYGSPYDTSPATFGGPLSLTNLQCTLGGVNVLNTSLWYTFENFLEQVSLAENVAPDVSVNVGVFNQAWWEQNRVYWIDLSRGREADRETMRNLTVSFTNNSNVPIDIMAFTVFLDKFVINVETGIITQ